MECTQSLAGEQKASMGAFGFSQDTLRTGAERDIFSIRLTILMMLIPNSQLVGWDGSKFTLLFIEAISLLHPTPQQSKQLYELLDMEEGAPFESEAYRALRDWRKELENGEVERGLSRFIMSSADLSRSDRLFPADPAVYSNGSAGLAYGASGILLALYYSGERIDPSYVKWIIQACRDEPGSHGAGLYGGAHGVAFALAEMGFRQEALELFLDLPSYSEARDHTIFDGYSGILLCYVHFAKMFGKTDMERKAFAFCAGLSKKILSEKISIQDMEPGLFYGAAGVSIMFCHMFRHTGHASFLATAKTLLLEEIKKGRAHEDGAFFTGKDGKFYPHLDYGSAGVGVALLEFSRYDTDGWLIDALSRIVDGCRSPFVHQSGLFQGRAGIIYFLSKVSKHTIGRQLSTDAYVKRHLEKLSWHAIRRDDGMAFPGRGLWRISTDLATGSAGVLWSIRYAKGQLTGALPFL